MPEEQETAAEETAGSEAASPQGETTETAAGSEAAAPEFGRSQVEEMISGMADQLSGKFTEQIGGMSGQMKQMYQMLQYLQRANAPQTKQPESFSLPDLATFSEYGGAEVHNLLSKMFQHFDGNTKETRNMIKKMLTDIKQERDQNQYFDYFQRHTENAAGQHELFKNPKFKKLLQYQVAARLNDCGEDLSKVDIPGVAKEIVDLFTSVQPAPTPPSQLPGSAPPAPGAPSRAGTKEPGEMKTLDDWEREFEPFMEDLYNRKAEEGGIEE